MNGDTDTTDQAPLQGIATEENMPLYQDEQPQGTLSEADMPIFRQPDDAGPSADVRLMHYGKHFNEYNHAANYDGDKELQDHDVAISPNVAGQLGLNKGDWVWVGPQLRRYNDVSAVAKDGKFDHYTNSTVEVRDYPADGRTKLRKATPEEVSASLSPSTTAGQMPSARQASYNSGLDPSQITAESVNKFLENVPQRALAAGEPPAASYQYAQSAQGAEQPSDYSQVADEASTADTSGTTADAGTGMSAGAGAGDTIVGDFSVPNSAHSKLTSVLPDGTRVFDNGAVTYHPNTDTLEWSIGGRSFIKTGRYGKVTSFNSAKIVRNPDTGEYFNMASGIPQKVQMPGQSPAYNPSLSTDANLHQLSPQDAATVQMFSNYQLPMTTRFGRLNPEYSRLRAYVTAANPDIDPRNYQMRQDTIKQYSSGMNGSPGQRMTSFNQALIHAGQLWDLAKNLPEGNFPKGNNVLNYLRTNAGDPAASAFQNQLGLFATEVSKAFKGGVPDQGDITRLTDNLSAASSKSQIETMIKDVFTKQIEGGMEALDFGYHRNMKTHYPDLLAPEAADALNKFGMHSFAGRDLTSMQKGGAQDAAQNAARQAAVQALRSWNSKHPDAQKDENDENTIKQAMKIMGQK